MKLSVVMPVYNERATLRTIYGQVAAVAIDKEIILVDDCSTDGTREIVRELGARGATVVLHDRNMGKGAALRSGFRHVTGDVVLIQDADLEYDPGQYPLLIQPILNGEADVVYGSRFLSGERSLGMSFWNRAGNRILTYLSNTLTKLELTDVETCYKVFSRDVLERITIEENRFGCEPEITAKLAKLGVVIREVGISYRGRTHAEGKKIGWRDFVSSVRCIYKYSAS
ncbi:glycosyltransferase family 2 protein [Geobacter pickeringii]|uniref:Glycosyl transferase n=1 Tax=Geobacter pickeringii TaxID=345632 RepID=A0A0B5B7G1_9BACT|nr:glycosyltransferase family 2 protein [Geobacter pickeringii]AJE02497.1 glycosyl transferase [Geobacter pickeringii]